ncbi:MAG TPA: hypothetical protein VE338_02040 [Ktedonobacterales bacterium]|jgi:hypothetical protein|nr:hypothetical protein [Ktedonobacterales bacterium]
MIDEQGQLYEHATVRVPFTATPEVAIAGRASTPPYGVAPYYFQRPTRPQQATTQRQSAQPSPLEAAIAERVAHGWEFLAIEDTVVKHDLDGSAYGSSVAVTTQAYYVLTFRRIKRPYGAQW